MPELFCRLKKGLITALDEARSIFPTITISSFIFDVSNTYGHSLYRSFHTTRSDLFLMHDTLLIVSREYIRICRDTLDSTPLL